MKSRLSKKHLKLDSIINEEWSSRVYRYKDQQFQEDCFSFLNRFCKSAKLLKPVTIFLDSPAGCLFASSIIEYSRDKRIYRLSMGTFSESTLQKIWYNSVSNSEYIKLATINKSQKDSIISSTLKAIEGVKVKPIEKDENSSYGYFFQYLFHSRNIEKIKKKINVHLWELYYPNGMSLKRDFMISSLNKFPDSNGNLNTYNYEEFLFFDLMSRIKVIHDSLFNDLRKVLLNGALDFYWQNNICLISKLPQRIKKDKTKTIQFNDGYTYKSN